jgi:SAM-dependent methyltransferase
MASNKTSYDRFAPYYDDVVGERRDVALFLRALLTQHHRDAKTILEFGCGTGSMLKVLSRNYAVTGVDNSRAMLKLASKKAPRAKLLFGDITTARVAGSFDAVLCPFDTINHITTVAQWRKVFANAARHLAPGGIFIFDINTPAKMERYVNEPITAEVGRSHISLVEVKRRGARRFDIIARLLTRSGSTSKYTLNSMVLRELILHPKEVIEEISKYFRTVTLIDPDRRYPTEETEELFFVCKNPR